jgi:hypothetical protein
VEKKEVEIRIESLRDKMVKAKMDVPKLTSPEAADRGEVGKHDVQVATAKVKMESEAKDAEKDTKLQAPGMPNRPVMPDGKNSANGNGKKPDLGMGSWDFNPDTKKWIFTTDSVEDGENPEFNLGSPSLGGAYSKPMTPEEKHHHELFGLNPKQSTDFDWDLTDPALSHAQSKPKKKMFSPQDPQTNQISKRKRISLEYINKVLEKQKKFLNTIKKFAEPDEPNSPIPSKPNPNPSMPTNLTPKPQTPKATKGSAKANFMVDNSGNENLTVIEKSGLGDLAGSSGGSG